MFLDGSDQTDPSTILHSPSLFLLPSHWVANLLLPDAQLGLVALISTISLLSKKDAADLRAAADLPSSAPSTYMNSPSTVVNLDNRDKEELKGLKRRQ